MQIDPIFISLLIGVVTGVISGLLPGIGNLFSMLILAPFISQWSALNIFICYATLIQIAQFVGSLSTIYTGMPGEASSMPAVTEIKNVPQSRYNEVIAATTIGSWVAATLSIMACWLLAQQFDSVAYFFRTELIFALLIIAIVMICNYSNNSKWTSIGLLMIGIVFGQVGWSNQFSTSILTFGIIELYQGLPLQIVVFCLFIVPQLYQFKQINSLTELIGYRFVVPSLNYLKLAWYSVVGFVGGMMPGLSTVFSSQLAYSMSSRSTKDPVERIVASETANNAGAVSQLIPLLVLGLPLDGGEAFTLALMEMRGFLAAPSTAAQYFILAAPALLLASFIGLVVAWPLANKILKLLNLKIIWFRIIISLMFLSYIFWQAHLDRNLAYIIYCMILLSVVGYLLRFKDTAVLIFGFFISDKIFDNSFRIIDLYF
jgi:putative tricarboxylic transport membrane protein